MFVCVCVCVYVFVNACVWLYAGERDGVRRVLNAGAQELDDIGVCSDGGEDVELHNYVLVRLRVPTSQSTRGRVFQRVRDVFAALLLSAVLNIVHAWVLVDVPSFSNFATQFCPRKVAFKITAFAPSPILGPYLISPCATSQCPC